jgi:CubicO group peptidase (beta-lactamase class C family)
VPGIGIAVVAKDRVVLAKGWGFRDCGKKLPFTPQTVVPIASNTKLFTAVAAGMLVEEGKLAWDAPVKQFVPSIRFYDNQLDATVSIRDMLGHRTGITRHDMIWYKSDFTRKELFERLRYLEPKEPIRQLFLYNNMMYAGAGYAIELLSGKAWEAFVQGRIFDPLGMSSSVFSIDALVAAPDHGVPWTERRDLRPGDGLWNTASARGPYRLFVADPEHGRVGFFGTIRENGKPAILALRLAIVDREIAEVEALVARSEEGARRLEALGQPHPVFSAAAPPMPREALVETANLYFVGLEGNDGKGVYPFTDDCDRIENGKQTTNHPAEPKRDVDIEALGCRQQFETGFFRFVTRIRDRRFVVVDQERGLVLAFVFFDHAGNVPAVTLSDGRTVPIDVKEPWTWEIAELFKIESGRIRRIEAAIERAPYGMASGWSTWEEGLSGEPRY